MLKAQPPSLESPLFSSASFRRYIRFVVVAEVVAFVVVVEDRSRRSGNRESVIRESREEGEVCV